LEGVDGGERQGAVSGLRAAAIAALVLSCVLPAAAQADPVPTIRLDRDGPVTVLVQSKSAANTLGIDVASPAPVTVCGNCLGGESVQLGAMQAGTELVLRLNDGQNHYLSTDPLHAHIDQTGGTWRIGWDDSLGDAVFQDLVVTVAVPTLPPPVDNDRDGVSPPTDCLDTNSAVHPGAPEIPGNGLDDDCVGGDALARVAATVTTKWNQYRKGGVRLSRLEVKDAPPNAQITVRCRGKHCFKTRTLHAGPTGAAKLLGKVPRRQRPHTTIDVIISFPNMIGKVRRYEVRKRDMTDGRTLCLPPGAKHAARC
jgi:hypothetical protein